MPTVKEAAEEFLSSRRVAVTGVSRQPASHGGNVVYKRLRERGYDVFPVNPNATEVEGDKAFPDLASIPDGVEAVVIATRPEAAQDTIEQCLALGIGKVWMHRGMGAGSCSEDAARVGREGGMLVIDGGCPLMFGPTADPLHKVMRFFQSLGKGAPSSV